MKNSIPRPEYPRPQEVRADWANLNGVWEFEFDQSNSGEYRGLQNEDAAYSEKITVPFAPQSTLSGIGHRDWLYGVWYKRTFSLSADRLRGRVIIHFGAVDYIAKLYINGRYIGSHTGGYVSFSFDITDAVREGENTVTLHAQDDERDPLVPRGKQCERFNSSGCSYTRTTGIWQTVWLEFLPEEHIRSFRFYPNVNACSVTCECTTTGAGVIDCTISYGGRVTARGSFETYGHTVFELKLDEKHLWEIGHGRLYDVHFDFHDDSVDSYFGLREVCYDGMKFLLNGKPVFGRLVLDQGFYPEGVYTAPTDAALEGDIKLSLDCGFNGARLHQKIFEPRFLYHADRAGYMVWEEFPDWGLDCNRSETVFSVLPEWLEAVERDFNHPSIVTWCPRNETGNAGSQDNRVIEAVYDATKAADRTRPCIDTSGYIHVKTDVYDLHDYNQDPVSFKEHYDAFARGEKLFEPAYGAKQHYGGQPVNISEFGGIQWSDDPSSWGYGNAPASPEEFIARFRGLCDAMLDNPVISGFCYTQLTDVEQEQNGLYTFARKPKFDCARFKEILSRTAEIEKE